MSVTVPSTPPNDRLDPSNESAPQATRRQWVSRLLSRAVSLWLKAQVESLDELHVEIAARDRQIFGGVLPWISLKASGVVYRGVHLSAVEMHATNIRVNLSEIVRGKPLQLLEPVHAEARILWQALDLHASVHSPLLAEALDELFAPALGAIAPDGTRAALSYSQLSLEAGQLCLSGSRDGDRFTLKTYLDAGDRRFLRFGSPSLTWEGQDTAIALAPFTVDLGEQVRLDHVEIAPEAIACGGHLEITA
ncbi:LmeA family phospholipid-binding protein [Oxynema aestuarii]|uniref:DUF2993 domain-containing protein n=1 Tax=Oxynema aestuarii AP17 TaxID=2064643 RepID=A0A6H1TST9_9CYAN|nr:DUF2993 domain-containing protein [Oxynema aestuarii]QIZ69662.1 DUF2993 domain-containing protein [Oxynema aestuarii AP17]